MTDNPLISLIIPVYNAAPYLRECLDSVRAQDHTSWECILVDDGSTDGSDDICQEVTAADPRFTYVHQVNAGASAARNAGLDGARGQWIAFCDADDTVGTSYLSSLAQGIAPDVDLVWHDLASQSEYIYINISNILQHPEVWHTCGPVAKLFRADIIRENHLRFAPITRAEDLDFAVRYLMHCQGIRWEGEKNYHYRRHEGSLTSRGRLFKDEMAIVRQLHRTLTVFKAMMPSISGSAPTDSIMGRHVYECLFALYSQEGLSKAERREALRQLWPYRQEYRHVKGTSLPLRLLRQAMLHGIPALVDWMMRRRFH